MVIFNLGLRFHFTVRLHPTVLLDFMSGKENIFGKYRFYMYLNKTVQKFASKFSCCFHLNMKFAMSTSIFLSTAREKPVKKAIFYGFMLVSNEET